ncbi:MAG: T9SS type A sorting domain-containing protein [Psychroserpens sp.]|uniref:T9SS type A sorting domain-containing protein n=1 Tax=Psychroserpens sp. TaxID=2020870 RepID=UPI003003465F
MKKAITLFFLLIGLSLNAQEFSMCNLTITSVSISGDVSFGAKGLDLSKACITLTGTSDICDSNGKVVSSGLTVTVTSSACSEDRMAGSGMSGDKIFIPFELLGETPKFEGQEIPLVYPNPSKGKFTLKTSKQNLKDSIKIISISNGKTVNASLIKVNNGYSIDLTRYPHGIYLLTYNKDGQEFSQKIIKN